MNHISVLNYISLTMILFSYAGKLITSKQDSQMKMINKNNLGILFFVLFYYYYYIIIIVNKLLYSLTSEKHKAQSMVSTTKHGSSFNIIN
jgi:hypothetical protein